uniref:Putative secreted protein n=1 Tax=Ixodes ricinus TaxID=34613 RepID=A0A6B0UK87_IXORI
MSVASTVADCSWLLRLSLVTQSTTSMPSFTLGGLTPSVRSKKSAPLPTALRDFTVHADGRQRPRNPGNSSRSSATSFSSPFCFSSMAMSPPCGGSWCSSVSLSGRPTLILKEQ